MLFPVFVHHGSESHDTQDGVPLATVQMTGFAYAPIKSLSPAFSWLFFLAPWLYMDCGLRCLAVSNPFKKRHRTE